MSTLRSFHGSTYSNDEGDGVDAAEVMMTSVVINNLTYECISDAISAAAKQLGISSPILELVLPPQQAAPANEEDTSPEQRSASYKY